VLRRVNALHGAERDGRTAFAGLGILKLGQSLSLAPRNNRLHGVEKLLPAADPRIVLEAGLTGKSDLAHRVLVPPTSLVGIGAHSEPDQELPKALFGMRLQRKGLKDVKHGGFR
jgi:hypothetical protein